MLELSMKTCIILHNMIVEDERDGYKFDHDVLPIDLDYMQADLTELWFRGMMHPKFSSFWGLSYII